MRLTPVFAISLVLSACDVSVPDDASEATDALFLDAPRLDVPPADAPLADAAGLDTPSLDVPVDAGPPPALAPRVSRLEVLTTEAQRANDPSGASGDAWGGHQSRIVRLSTGELYAVYMHAPAGITTPSDAEWVLMHRGPADADRWTEVARERAGREPMHLLRGPDDTTHILSWPGLPRHWMVSGGVVDAGVEIPGGWETHVGSGTPYSGAGIATDGRICWAGSRGTYRPGGIYTSDSAWDIACRSPSGTWSPMQTLPIGLRYCYPFLHVESGTGLELLGTRDILWEAIGLSPVPGTFAYILDAVDVWSFSAPTDTAPARTNVGLMPFETPATNAPGFRQSDSHIDLAGRLHVLVQTRRSTGDWQMLHFVRGTDGSIAMAPIDVGGYTDGALRLIEDPYGRLLLLFVQGGDQYLFPLEGPEGFTLGARIDLTAALGTGTSASEAYITSVRAGNLRAGVVDLLMAYDTGGGAHETRYARIALYE